MDGRGVRPYNILHRDSWDHPEVSPDILEQASRMARGPMSVLDIAAWYALRLPDFSIRSFTQSMRTGTTRYKGSKPLYVYYEEEERGGDRLGAAISSTERVCLSREEGQHADDPNQPDPAPLALPWP
eukprot:1038317-Rhodomonas_salina.1